MGCMLIYEHVTNAYHIALHVEDILVSGPNYDKTCATLDWILDCAVRMRLIYQSVKTKPPSLIHLFGAHL
jgi:hypothetical protein